MHRSYLFAPGHNTKLLNRVFTAGADAVILALEDAVPPDAKATARAMVAEALLDHPAWVRVNAAQTAWGEADLDAVADRAFGIRIPKVESPSDVEWVTARAPGKPIICAIESTRGVLAAQQIAAVPGVRFLAIGGVDLQRDLNTSGGNLQTLYARSHLVLASRAAGIEPPIDSVYPTWTTPQAYVTKPGSPDRWVSTANPRSTPVNSTPCTRCSPPPRTRSSGPTPCSPGSTPPAAPASRCPPANSSTSPSPTGPAACWRSRVLAFRPPAPPYPCQQRDHNP